MRYNARESKRERMFRERGRERDTEREVKGRERFSEQNVGQCLSWSSSKV